MKKKIRATTAVMLPVGTPIEQYGVDKKPRIGYTFDIYHIDTKKVVLRARVVGISPVEHPRYGKSYTVRSVIIEVVE